MPVSRSVHWAAAAALVIGISGCSPSANPPETMPSPTPSAPAPAPARYAPIDDAYCDDAQLQLVPADFDLRVPFPDNTRPMNQVTRPGEVWQITCRFETRSEDRFFGARGSVEVTVYAETADASSHYESHAELVPPSAPDSALLTPIEGWWDQGRYLAYTESRQRDVLLRLRYLVRHDNLLIHVRMGSDFPEDDQRQSIALAHEVARALLEEALPHVPLLDNQ